MLLWSRFTFGSANKLHFELGKMMKNWKTWKKWVARNWTDEEWESTAMTIKYENAKLIKLAATRIDDKSFSNFHRTKTKLLDARERDAPHSEKKKVFNCITLKWDFTLTPRSPAGSRALQFIRFNHHCCACLSFAIHFAFHSFTLAWHMCDFFLSFVRRARQDTLTSFPLVFSPLSSSCTAAAACLVARHHPNHLIMQFKKFKTFLIFSLIMSTRWLLSVFFLLLARRYTLENIYCVNVQ